MLLTNSVDKMKTNFIFSNFFNIVTFVR